jgi:TonB family protein
VIHSDEPCCSHKAAQPDTLDRNAIASGLASVNAAVMACRSAGTGAVKVRIAVRGDGQVADAGVESAPDPALGACVVSAVQRAQFPRTKSGRSFKYTFSL